MLLGGGIRNGQAWPLLIGVGDFSVIERRFICGHGFRSLVQNAHRRRLRQFIVVRFSRGGEGQRDHALGNILFSSSVRLFDQFQGIDCNSPEISGGLGFGEGIFDMLRNLFRSFGNNFRLRLGFWFRFVVARVQAVVWV